VRLPHGVVRRLAASLTGVVDLSSGRGGAGGVTFYGTVATGFGVP
jgi:hypothetical protein